MTPADVMTTPLARSAQALRERHEPFAFATIVRTAGPTAAKPGAKALLAADGTIIEGWLGGGCTRNAVRKAALRAIATGQPQLVSVAPEEELAALKVSPGDEIGGKSYARNGCPSKGSIEVFIEPVLPMPLLTVLGGSPVAQALAALAPGFHWAVGDSVAEGPGAPLQVIVVATQGQGDMDALVQALESGARLVSFVGSRRKFAALAEKLAARGVDADRIAAVRAPAGLDIGAVTPEEIALSILAELVHHRRRVTQAVAHD